MHNVPSKLFRRLVIVTSVAVTLLAASGCMDTPIIGDDIRVVRDSPHYLREAYLFADKDPVSDADESFRTGNRRLYGAIAFGTYYPGCAPGVGEKLARRYGTILLPETAGTVETDAQEYYRSKVTIYAAAYNAEMVSLLGASRLHPR